MKEKQHITRRLRTGWLLVLTVLACLWLYGGMAYADDLPAVNYTGEKINVPKGGYYVLIMKTGLEGAADASYTSEDSSIVEIVSMEVWNLDGVPLCVICGHKSGSTTIVVSVTSSSGDKKTIRIPAVVGGAEETTAKPAAVKMNVTLNGNGKGVSLAKTRITVTKGKKYGSLPTPSRKGYSFQGWYTKKSGGTKVTKNTKVTKAKDHTLYAHWKADKKKIYVILMGASCDIETFEERLIKTGDWKSAPKQSTLVDVLKLGAVFKNLRIDGYEKPEVISRTKTGTFKKSEINSALKSTLGKAGKNDLCFFVYCGHGTYTEMNGNVTGLGITVSDKKDYYPYAELDKNVSGYCKGKVVMMICSCFAGGYAEAAKGYKNLVVIPACGSNETTGNTYLMNEAVGATIKFFKGIDTDMSDLAYYVVKGLGKGHPMDGNGDKKITVSELKAYIEKKMNARNQHPNAYTGSLGNLVICNY